MKCDLDKHVWPGVEELRFSGSWAKYTPRGGSQKGRVTGKMRFNLGVVAAGAIHLWWPPWWELQRPRLDHVITGKEVQLQLGQYTRVIGIHGA